MSTYVATVRVSVNAETPEAAAKVARRHFDTTVTEYEVEVSTSDGPTRFWTASTVGDEEGEPSFEDREAQAAYDDEWVGRRS